MEFSHEEKVRLMDALAIAIENYQYEHDEESELKAVALYKKLFESMKEVA